MPAAGYPLKLHPKHAVICARVNLGAAHDSPFIRGRCTHRVFASPAHPHSAKKGRPH